eukprot:gene2091-1963_t
MSRRYLGPLKVNSIEHNKVTFEDKNEEIIGDYLEEKLCAANKLLFFTVTTYSDLFTRSYLLHRYREINITEKLKKLEDSAMYCFKNQKYEHAVKYCQEAIKLNPKESKLYITLGICLNNLYKFEDGWKILQEALTIEKSSEGFYYSFQACVAIGNLKEAEKQLKNAQEIENDEKIKNEFKKLEKIKKYWKIFSDYLNIDSNLNALDNINLILELVPHSIFFELKKVETLINLKEFDNTISILDVILMKQPKNSNALFLKAQSLYLNGSVQKTIKTLGEIEQLDSKMNQFKESLEKIESFENEAINLFDQKDFKKSLDKYSDIIEILVPKADIMNSKIYFQRSCVFESLGNYKSALADLAVSIKLNPKFKKSFIQKSRIYENQGEYESAILALESYGGNNDVEISDKMDHLRDLLKADFKNYFTILNVEQNATNEEISKSRRFLRMKNHPDMFVDPTEKEEADIKFRLIEEAFEILSDQKTRKQFEIDLEEHLKKEKYKHIQSIEGKPNSQNVEKVVTDKLNSYPGFNKERNFSFLNNPLKFREPVEFESFNYDDLNNEFGCSATLETNPPNFECIVEETKGKQTGKICISNYQSITRMDYYSKYSFEELAFSYFTEELLSEEFQKLAHSEDFESHKN